MVVKKNDVMKATVAKAPSPKPLPAAAPGGNSQEITTLRGKAIPSAYLSLPGARTDAFQPPPPGRLRMLITGGVGTGKTSFAGSIPNAAHFDFDRKSSAVANLAPGSVVFGNTGIGQKPWTLKEWEQLVNLLIRDGEAGNHPFSTIVIDTTASMCDLVRNWYTVQYDDKLRDGFHFGSYGQSGAGYDVMNSYMLDMLKGLTNVGYGLICLTHWEVKIHQKPDGSSFESVKLAGFPGVIAGIYRMCEYAGCIRRDRIAEQVVDEKTIGGKTFKSKRTEVSHKYVLDLSYEVPGASPENRQHIPLTSETIEIPEGRGWQAFESIYNESVQARRRSLGLSD